MRQVIKANKLPEQQYVELLGVAKYLRNEIAKLHKHKTIYRVYTEARKGGLRSKIEMCVEGNMKINTIQTLANHNFPDLNIVVKMHKGVCPRSNDGICIFIKVN